MVAGSVASVGAGGASVATSDGGGGVHRPRAVCGEQCRLLCVDAARCVRQRFDDVAGRGGGVHPCCVAMATRARPPSRCRTAGTGWRPRRSPPSPPGAVVARVLRRGYRRYLFVCAVKG